MENKQIIYLNLNNIDKKIKLEEKINNNMNNLFYLLINKLKKENYIVYTNESNNIDEIINFNNDIKPDAYISLNVSYLNGVGPIVYTNNRNSLGDIIANKIHKQLKLIHYDTTIVKDIVYTENIKEIVEINLPTVYVELFSINDESDIKWFIDNVEKISNSIFIGIDNYFKDRY